jgi:2'-5' RNA ligase
MGCLGGLTEVDMSLADGSSWADWRRDYIHGALVIEPPADLAAILDPIRMRLDPVSAERIRAHITVTPPFSRAPMPPDEARVSSVVGSAPPLDLQLGPPRRFEGSSVIHLPVVDPTPVLNLREELLATGLFRMDLPHTTGFVPHLTLSEFGPTPDAALKTVIPDPVTRVFRVGEVAWVTPNEEFTFSVRHTFPLG